MTSKIHIVFILLSGVFWGCMGLCNRVLTPLGFSSGQIFFLRCFVSCVFLALFLLLTNRKAFVVKAKDLWCFLGSGLLSLTVFGLSYLTAQNYMSLSMAVVLLYTSPVWVVLLSALFFKEGLNRTKICALVLVILGALFTCGIFSGSLEVSVVGIILGLISGLGYGLYSIFSRFALQKGYDSFTITFYTFFFAAIVTAFLCEPLQVPALVKTPSTLGWILFLGIVTSLLAYGLYTKGLEKVSNGLASVLSTSELIASTLIGVALFHESFGLQNLLGIAFVIGGICLMNKASEVKSSVQNETANMQASSEFAAHSYETCGDKAGIVRER